MSVTKTIFFFSFSLKINNKNESAVNYQNPGKTPEK